MLSKHFIKLVIISVVIANPLVWLAMNSWLQNYAYRIEINGCVILISAMIAMLIDIITASFSSSKQQLKTW